MLADPGLQGVAGAGLGVTGLMVLNFFSKSATHLVVGDLNGSLTSKGQVVVNNNGRVVAELLTLVDACRSS